MKEAKNLKAQYVSKKKEVTDFFKLQNSEMQQLRAEGPIKIEGKAKVASNKVLGNENVSAFEVDYGDEGGEENKEEEKDDQFMDDDDDFM